MGTAPTGCTSPTTGTLTSQGAKYTQPYSYDVLNRFSQGPLGAGYSYGDTTHLDAVTTAPTYTASYDAAGNMTTRNGQQLGYDALRRLIAWQNTVTNPTQTASYAYNGSGERVQQVVTSGGATTTTSYLGGYEEVSVTGGTTTTTKYYSAGLATVTNVNGTLSYLVHDTLGSVSASLTASGGLQSAQLFAPYGAVRYSTGMMPTTYGFTGQRSDPSGLMYYHARYYDPSVGQFASADAAQGPNRYGYVAGNPETQTDPTGQRLVCDDQSGNCLGRQAPNRDRSPRQGVADNGGGNGGDSIVQHFTPKVTYRNYQAGYDQYRNSDTCHSLTGKGCYVDLRQYSFANPLAVYKLRYKPDPIEDEDGRVLARYFGTTVIHPVEGDSTTPDYIVGINFYGLGINAFAYGTSMDLFTPESNTSWTGIRKTARDKAGSGQAGVIVIDLRNVSGRTDKEFLDNEAARIMGPVDRDKHIASSVTRVIYISQGSVVDDFDPNSFGPSKDPNGPDSLQA